MGVVYRARDLQLQRDVSLKLLPDDVAHEPERLVRFQREAQVLASLNHPNIAQIYGLQQGPGSSCIVMELVEGETLAERLKRGPISIAETLRLERYYRGRETAIRMMRLLRPPGLTAERWTPPPLRRR